MAADQYDLQRRGLILVALEPTYPTRVPLGRLVALLVSEYPDGVSVASGQPRTGARTSDLERDLAYLAGKGLIERHEETIAGKLAVAYGLTPAGLDVEQGVVAVPGVLIGLL